jgi:hypothetical protein
LILPLSLFPFEFSQLCFSFPGPVESMLDESTICRGYPTSKTDARAVPGYACLRSQAVNPIEFSNTLDTTRSAVI